MAVAAEIMTRDVITVGPETPVAEVADLLSKQRFGSVPVVTEEGVVLGLVSEEDLVIRASRVHLPRYITFLGGVVFLENPQNFELEAKKILAMTAREIMHRNVASVTPDTPVENLAERMLNEDLRRLLVLEDGKLVGIITRADIVRLQAGHPLPGEG